MLTFDFTYVRNPNRNKKKCSNSESFFDWFWQLGNILEKEMFLFKSNELCDLSKVALLIARSKKLLSFKLIMFLNGYSMI